MKTPNKTYKSKAAALLDDPYLQHYQSFIDRRKELLEFKKKKYAGSGNLSDFANGHHYYGMRKTSAGSWTFREWAPNAQRIFLIGDFSGWKEMSEFELKRINKKGDWEIELAEEKISHEMLYKLKLYWEGGEGERIPSYATRAVQDFSTNIFSAQVWEPERPYVFKHSCPEQADPIIYEAHTGMAGEAEDVSSFIHFADHIIPYIAECEYNTIQLMAVMEHPYYGSFGYHVSNYFAVSSRFGTPEDFKYLVDRAHSLGLRIVMDIVHSHSVKNEQEGLARFDGTIYQYFHEGEKGNHWLWDSYCFDYSKPEVVHFLLSNCKYWLEEYNIDGFRFDGITSMLYSHHGLGKDFTSYDDYFNGDADEDAFCYLALANELTHQIHPNAMTIAEDVSGMPGLCCPVSEGGCGFDFRMAMGVTDCWFKLLDIPDESWNISYLTHELLNKRAEEKTISYVECHDQALVGGKTAIFTLIDKEMYFNMHAGSENLVIDRGIALHKIMRIATIFTGDSGYLNFMGNEFGHPEWIDFPREGNGWSYKYARRQWSLKDDKNLRYHHLLNFDNAAIKMAGKEEIYKTDPCLLHFDSQDKVFAVKRGEMVLFVNLHPEKSYEGYGVECLPGKYHIALNSDKGCMGGFERIDEQIDYYTEHYIENDTVKNILKVYLPSRTAVVLKRNEALASHP
ncbi:alpha-amylase family glycosyl hydrolase [Sedimentisphaera salicampi]|uniref:alpha-amylase family glycosyl hydrolase n=1 Tax=Sedimentisphaera salicampi TaxID=1941349 RepID=UPI000B9B1929|nr:alpha-amylase family glycosyl hydrolase [Sedimentisphaera salicampi]OXU15994.1 1,4-alpha-glucan branching enzyme GlgB [Sedimentisphaera salicampi]